MHGEALSAAIDAWLDDLREECEIEIEKRRAEAGGETVTVVADDNPWEDHDDGRQEVSVIPPRDGRTRVLFLGGGRDEERGLSYAYFDTQSSLGEHVDVSDQHRIQLWIGAGNDAAGAAIIRAKYEDAVRDGIWEHLISVDQLMKSLAADSPLGPNVADLVGRINRRMA